MELWLVYAIISSILIWINNFCLKIFSEKGFDSSILQFMQGAVYMLAWFLQASLFELDFWLWWKWYLLIPTFFIIIFYFSLIRIRVAVLKYLSSSEYFVSYRILSTITLLIVGLFIFHEHVSLAQLFWLFLGSIGIILLFEEDKKLRTGHNWTRSILLLLGSVFAGIMVQVLNKYIATASDLFGVILCYQWIMTITLSLVFEWSKIKNLLWKSKILSTSLFWIASLTVIISYFATSFNFLTYAHGGNISIVPKIIAYSLFIPIILSMIFYHEKMSYKKWIAFILTIISIYYLN